MFINRNYEAYILEDCEVPSRIDIMDFFLDNHKEDVIIIKNKGIITDIISYKEFLYDKNYKPILINASENVYEEAKNASIGRDNAICLIVSADGEPLTFLEKSKDLISVEYDVEAKNIDIDILRDTDFIILNGMDEYNYTISKVCQRYYPKIKQIMIGEDWRILPEWIEKTEAVVTDNISKIDESIIDNKRGIYVIQGIPEWMDEIKSRMRLNDRLFFGVELIQMLFFFTDNKCFGSLNPDKKIFVLKYFIDPYIGLFGFFGIMNIHAQYAKSKGYIPVFDLSWDDTSHYRDRYNTAVPENLWTKFFEQPDKIEVSEAYQSKNVTISNKYWSQSVCQEIMKDSIKCNEDKYIISEHFSNRILEYLSDELKSVPVDEDTLGVLIRGTDYVKQKPSGHPIQADAKMMIEKIEECIKMWKNYSKVYLSTEDGDILDILKEHFGEKLIYNNQYRFRNFNDVRLGEAKIERENDGFLRGAEYISSMYLLSRCESLVASGECAGVGIARVMNNGRYKNQFIFNLGTYK